LKVKILGAAREVGRSGFLVDCDGTNLLLDYGMLFGNRDKPPQFPLHVKPKDVDSIIITHAHLDHSGNVPSMFVSGHCNVYGTEPTFELSRLLIEDMLKIEKGKYPFDIPEVDSMIRNSKGITFGEKIHRGDASFELRSSGHVIGGSTVLVESKNKRLFYTGDINLSGSRMLPKADTDIGEVDMVITESTYSQTNQMPRKESEERLLEFANEVIERKGILFIPSFSVERSQEIACVLRSANFKHKVVMDGMALKVNEIILRYPEFLREQNIFADAVNHAVSIKNQRDREKAISEPCVIISPAGMLVGGNAVYYLQKLAFDDRNGIALVSYQGDGTPGKKLLETGKITARGQTRKSSAEVKQFQFSGHSDRALLFEMIKQLKGNPKILTVHGDDESCQKFAEEIHEKFGFETHSPLVGETISI